MDVELPLRYSLGMLNMAGAAMLTTGLIEWSHDQVPIASVLVCLGMICIVFNAVIMHKLKQG